MTERELFIAALRQPGPAERAAFLESVCREDVSLRKRVEEMLAEHDRLGSFLERPADAAAAAPVAVSPEGERTATHGEPRAELPKEVIGSYKLVEVIGEGGMGTVWLAQQIEPVKRLVALKVIKAGMDTAQVLARFEAERQALALMDHPNIAKVLDAGATGAGRPYFVMELVKGVPITRYCDEHKLTPRDRLHLFVQVCQAVQHAHQKGVIHRDLKPSNVLVAPFDGKPVVKVIDFGVAKAAGVPLTEKTLVTGFGAVVGTPEYMSPEQAELNNADIDTRSDIYSLGILLYELLTGTTPLTKKRVKEAALLEVLRLVREEEPPKPSTRLGTTEELPSIAAVRGTEPARLSKLVRGELDWIVMKALEKDRNRRYETANGFAMDVQRYLADEAVQACPPSMGYRLRKFGRRNKAALAVAGLVLFFLAVLGGGIGWAVRDRAARDQEVARDGEIRREMLEGEIGRALAEVEHWYRRKDDTEARAALRRAEFLLDTGDVSAELRTRVSQWRFELELVQRLEEIMLRSWIDKCEGAPVSNDDMLRVFREMDIDIDALPVEEAGRCVRARLCWERFTAALEYLCYVRQEMFADCKLVPWAARARIHEIVRAVEPDSLRSHAHRVLTSNRDETAKLADQPGVLDLPPTTLRLMTMTLYWGSSQHRVTGMRLLRDAQARRPGDFWLNHTCAAYYQQMNPPDWSNALHFYSMALAIRPQNANLYASVARACANLGRHEEAVSAFARLIDLRPDDASTWYGRARAYHSLNQFDKAVLDFSKAIELHPKVAAYWNNRGNAYKRLNQLDKALADHSKAVELNPKDALAWNNRGADYSGLGQQDKALADFTRATELDPKKALYWRNRGLVNEKLGKWAEMAADYSKLIELDARDAQAWHSRGIAHLKSAKLDNALADLTRALELNDKYTTALAARATVHGRMGQWDKAIADRSRLVELASKNAVACNDLAWLLVTCPEDRLRDSKRAVELARKAVELDQKNGTIWNTLGAALVRAGDHQEAIPALTKSMDLRMGGDAFDWFLLAMAEWHLSKKDDARKWYDKAVEWMKTNKPNDEELRRFRAEAESVLELKTK